MNVPVLLMLVVCVLNCLVKVSDGHTTFPRLLLISFDGFRWDYLDLVKKSGRKVPNFDRLLNNGVYATVHNSFVTKTFPNHYTIATGLYEENHGVVQNEMFDPNFGENGEVFNNANGQWAEEKWWNNGSDRWPGVPIWLANEQASNPTARRRSGVYFWPGSEAVIHHEHITHTERYNWSVPLLDRINTVIDWFTEEHHINLGVLYFEEPDHHGHMIGPSNQSIYDVIVYIDNHVGILIDKMEEHNLFDHVNLIITSDHGMVDIVGAKYLEDYVDPDLFDHYGHSPVFNIMPKKDKHDEVYKALKATSDLHVFLKEDIPRKYHYTYNRRIQPIVVSAPKGYDLCPRRNCTYGKGNHGYNNSMSEMHPIFIGHGPAFKKGYKSPTTFDNVDIYPLMCKLLDIDPPPHHDGNIDHVKHLLITHDNSTLTMLTYMITLAFAATITGVITVAALRVQRSRHRHRQRLLVTAPHSNSVYIPNHTELEGHSHLLGSEDEEIP